jgi:hypothetical protein
VQHSAKQFVEKLNKSLDNLGVPINSKERTAILSKMLDISKPQAWSLLEGRVLPDPTLLKKISVELEITF